MFLFIYCCFNKIKFIFVLEREEGSIVSGMRGLYQDFLFGEMCFSFFFSVKVLFYGDFNWKFLEFFILVFFISGLVFFIFQVCLGLFVNDWQVGGDVVLLGLISWVEICISFQKISLGFGRKQQGFGFKRECF